MEPSPVHISRSRSGTRQTTQGHPSESEVIGLLVGDLEPPERIQDKQSSPINKHPKLPWWKTPSPWWLLMTMPFTSIATSVTIAPRIEVYTTLACSIHRPDILGKSLQQLNIFDFLQHSDGYRIPDVASSVDVRSDVFMIDWKSIQTNDTDTPPTKKQRCASDPVVQAAVAKLTTVITASMGILTCITTGWWGSFTDRYGRTSVMGLSLIGLLLTDFSFIIVTLFPKHVPGGYWFLVIGPMVEGVLGGTTGALAASYAYLADTSNESNRSRIFALNAGLVQIGTALGPSLGSLLIRFTGQVLSVFYLAGCLHVLYSCLVWFIMPESLPKGHMELARTKYAHSLRAASPDPENGTIAGFVRNARGLFFFLRPLTILGPIEEADKNISKGRRKNWNLTLVAVAFGFMVSSLGSHNYIFQYAAATFRWSSETMGYWISAKSGLRAIYLVLILPIMIRLLKPKPLILELPVVPVETTPLLNPSSSSLSAAVTRKTIKKEIHSPLFDLNLARVSLLVDIVYHILMGLAQSPILFGLSCTLGALSAGFRPAVQSVTLALYAGRDDVETGKLFGALSLVQALSSQILAPFIYGFVYAKTVALYPRMIFFIIIFAVFTSYCLLGLVRLPKDEEYHCQSFADLEESGSSEGSSSQRV